MRAWFVVGLLLAGCDINHPVTNLVTGTQDQCLNTTRPALPDINEDLNLWTFGAEVVAVYDAQDAPNSSCAKASAQVIELQSRSGERLSVGWRTVVEGVDVTPVIHLDPGDPIIVRYGQLRLDRGRHSSALVLRHGDGDLIAAMEDGAGLTIEDLPGNAPITVSLGEVQHGIALAPCGRAMNVALRVHGDRIAQVKAGKRAELFLDDRAITAVNVGAVAGRDPQCDDVTPWFVVQGHDVAGSGRRPHVP